MGQAAPKPKANPSATSTAHGTRCGANEDKRLCQNPIRDAFSELLPSLLSLSLSLSPSSEDCLSVPPRAPCGLTVHILNAFRIALQVKDRIYTLRHSRSNWTPSNPSPFKSSSSNSSGIRCAALLSAYNLRFTAAYRSPQSKLATAARIVSHLFATLRIAS